MPERMGLKNYSSESYFPSKAIISRSAFVHNLHLAQKLAGQAEVMAVIKADAYGHGAYQIGSWALDQGVEWLVVAQLAEALELRKALGQRGKMLALIAQPNAPFAAALKLGIDLSLSDSWMLEQIASAASKTGICARIHIEIDTGMSRGGFTLAALEKNLPQIIRYTELGLIEPVGLWSHFACADTLTSDVTSRQKELFEQAKSMARAAKLTIRHYHIAASSALLWHPDTYYTMVRPGALLYGISPEPANATAEELGFRPVMQLVADIVSVREIKAGTGVSYGHTAVVKENTKLATVPLGYADGILRHASNRAEVVVNQKRSRIIGRVCMDQFVIAAQNAAPGDTVTLFGAAADGFPTADDWAKWCDTIGYEIVSKVGVRVPRYYVE